MVHLLVANQNLHNIIYYFYSWKPVIDICSIGKSTFHVDHNGRSKCVTERVCQEQRQVCQLLIEICR